MMSTKHVATFRDLTDKKDVVFQGPGSFEIGLSTDGSVIVEPDDSTDGVCIVLLVLTASPSGGYVLAPANKDLPCVVNESEDLTGEINLINGTRLEVANKTLVFIDGPIPVRRRKLPRTPGMPLEDAPPSKPSRAQTPEKSQAPVAEQDHQGDSTTNFHTVHPDNHEDSDDNSEAEEEAEEDKRWLETSWCMLDMTTAEQQLFSGLNTPEQISIVAASYFCKQVRLFTDANLTMQLLDDIFKLFKDSVIISKDIFLDYLSEISKMIQKNPRRSQTRPMHGPAIKLLNSLLKQSLEPLPRVILLLDLVRTFSHFDSNLVTMARHQVAATVCGCMSVYCDVVEVQSYGLDTLAKIAKFKPVIDKKAPLREGAVQIILKSENQHHKNLTICRSLCRVLANLAASVIDATNSLLDTESATNTRVSDAIEKYEELLLFMFKWALPVVQTILDDHGTDLGVHTEGRRFVYYYAKLPQLQQKKKLWLQTIQPEEETLVEITSENNTSAPAIQDMLAYRAEEDEPRGILKRIGSFENLRDPNKKIMFADTTIGGSASDTSSSDDELFAGPFPESKIPTQIEMEEDFSFHLVKTFIGKTIGKKHRSKKSSDSSDSSSDEEDFLARNSVKSFAQKVKTEKDKEIDENTSRLKLVSENSVVRNGDNSNAQDKNNNEEDNTDASIINSDNVTAHTDTDITFSIETTEEGGTENSSDNERSKEFVPTACHENEPIDKDETEVLCSENGLGSSGLQEISDVSESLQEPNIQTEPLNSMNSSENSCVSNNIVIPDGKDTSSNGWDIIDNAELRGMGEGAKEEVVVEILTCGKNEVKPDFESASNLENKTQSVNSVNDILQQKKDSDVVDGTNDEPEVRSERKIPAHFDRKKDTCVVDVPFMGKLVRTQIITHVGSLVFQGDDSKVLLVIDQPIAELLEHAAAPVGLIEFARTQYGKDMTLMDLEPSIVISAIDAVRYRSVTAELVQKAVLSLTRAITHKLQSSTVNLTMLFYKTLFADKNMKSIITEKQFVKEFKVCFSNATERLQTSHNIEEIRAELASPSFVV